MRYCEGAFHSGMKARGPLELSLPWTFLHSFPLIFLPSNQKQKSTTPSDSSDFPTERRNVKAAHHCLKCLLKKQQNELQRSKGPLAAVSRHYGPLLHSARSVQRGLRAPRQKGLLNTGSVNCHSCSEFGIEHWLKADVS